MGALDDAIGRAQQRAEARQVLESSREQREERLRKERSLLLQAFVREASRRRVGPYRLHQVREPDLPGWKIYEFTSSQDTYEDRAVFVTEDGLEVNAVRPRNDRSAVWRVKYGELPSLGLGSKEDDNGVLRPAIGVASSLLEDVLAEVLISSGTA